jgi:hypothetical protein
MRCTYIGELYGTFSGQKVPGPERAEPVDMGIREGWYSGNTGAQVLDHEAEFEPDPGGSVF